MASQQFQDATRHVGILRSWRGLSVGLPPVPVCWFISVLSVGDEDSHRSAFSASYGVDDITPESVLFLSIPFWWHNPPPAIYIYIHISLCRCILCAHVILFLKLGLLALLLGALPLARVFMDLGSVCFRVGVRLLQVTASVAVEAAANWH